MSLSNPLETCTSSVSSEDFIRRKKTKHVCRDLNKTNRKREYPGSIQRAGIRLPKERKKGRENIDISSAAVAVCCCLVCAVAVATVRASIHRRYIVVPINK